MQETLQTQALSYLTALYPDLKNEVINNFLQSSEFDGISFINKSIEKSCMNLIPLAIAFNKFNLSFDKDFELNQSNVHAFHMPSTKIYKTKIKLIIDIEEIESPPTMPEFLQDTNI